jgi:hypothetical protein
LIFVNGNSFPTPQHQLHIDTHAFTLHGPDAHRIAPLAYVSCLDLLPAHIDPAIIATVAATVSRKTRPKTKGWGILRGQSWKYGRVPHK